MNLSPIGLFHTIIGIIALLSGFLLLWKNKRISYQPILGKVYLLTTFITAGSSLTIFKHGSGKSAQARGV